MGVRITPKQNDRLTVTPLQEVINGTQVQLAANTTNMIMCAQTMCYRNLKKWVALLSIIIFSLTHI